MSRIIRLSLALALLVCGAVVATVLAPVVPATSSPAPAVPYASDNGGGAVPVPADPAATVPAPSDMGGAVVAVPVDPADPYGDGDTSTVGDGPDPVDVDLDALPDDAPRVCHLLDMGAASCEAFVHPAPGEVSVAILYSDDDEHAIVETIAYSHEGPLEYVDFWEGTAQE